MGVLLGLQLTLHPFRGCPSYDAIDHLPLAERVREMRKSRAARRDPGRFRGPARSPLSRRSCARSICSIRWAAIPTMPRQRRCASRRLPRVSGKSLAECAYDALLEQDGEAILYLPARNYTDFTLDTVEAMLRREDTVLGLGDGGAHVGAICDGSMPTFLLSHWTRGGKFSIPEAVAMMTGHTARVSGFGDRGIDRARHEGRSQCDRL